MTTTVTLPSRSEVGAPEGPSPRRLLKMVLRLRGLAPLVVLLALWQGFGDPFSPYFPPPSRWWAAVSLTAASGDLWIAILDTIIIFAASLALSVVIGSVLGVLLGSSARVHASLNPMFQFLRAIPAAAIVPAGSLILGVTPTMMISVVVLASVWPIMLSTRSAVVNINPLLLDVSATLGLSRAQRVRSILLPALTSHVLLGARVAAPIALIITLLVQLLTGRSGVGALLGLAQSQFNGAAVYGYVVICGLLAIGVNALLRALDRIVTRHLPPTE